MTSYFWYFWKIQQNEIFCSTLELWWWVTNKSTAWPSAQSWPAGRVKNHSRRCREFLLLSPPALTDVCGVWSRCRGDATSRHQDGHMYEGSTGWMKAIPQSYSSPWGRFLCTPQALVKLGTTRTAMAATATATTARFQPSQSRCREMTRQVRIKFIYKHIRF